MSEVCVVGFENGIATTSPKGPLGPAPETSSDT